MSTLLTIGDSVVWGQGLAQEHKTAAIVARHLGAELHMLAHSGAKIGIRDSYSVTMPSGEVPCFFPTILQQLHAFSHNAAFGDSHLHGAGRGSGPGDSLRGGAGHNAAHGDSHHDSDSHQHGAGRNAKDSGAEAHSLLPGNSNDGNPNSDHNNPNSNDGNPKSNHSPKSDSGKLGAPHSDDAKLKDGQSSEVRWVLMNGGINDVEIQRIFNPMVPQYELELHVRNYCGRDLLALLRKVTHRFSNAQILLLGYYPGLSHQSRREGIELLYSLIHGVDFAPVCEPELFRNEIVEHCLRFWKLSDGLMRSAVEHVNREAGRTRAIFVDSGLTEANAAYAPQSLLWELDLDDPERAPDEVAEERRAASERVAAGPLQKRQCLLSSIGHPNVAGAALMARQCIEAWRAAGHASSVSA